MMGTTTFFLRLNDCGKPLHKMDKKELEELNNLSPYDDKPYCGGWGECLKMPCLYFAIFVPR